MPPDLQQDPAAFQGHILSLVSRTFALTIPELPEPLRHVVANAYLLCRAADTIEDDIALDPAQKRRFEEELIEVVGGRRDAHAFVGELHPLLSSSTSQAERDLMFHLPAVIRITHDFTAAQRAAIERCLGIMCDGMHRFQLEVGVRGLASQRDLDAYCYHVGGVVGEMLTELFCQHCPTIARHREELVKRASSFGQGLQMTNILKDQWEDRARGVCWLPRDLFQRLDLDLERLSPGQGGPAYAMALEELVGIAHAHLRNALDYTLLIPAHAGGIRRFCYWAIDLAACTLRNIHRRPGFTSGTEVKVPRASVANLILLTKVAGRHDALLRSRFDFSARGLPLRPLA